MERSCRLAIARSLGVVLSVVLGLGACAAPTPNNTARPTDPATTSGRRVGFEIDYAVQVGPGTSRVVLTTLLPRSRLGRQHVHGVVTVPQPDRVWDEQGNRYATFTFVAPRRDFHVRIRCDVTIERSDLTAARARQTAPARRPNLRPFVASEPFLEADDVRVQQLARQLTRATSSELAAVRSLHDGVLRALTVHGYRPQDIGARGALNLGSGDCTDYADLFVALCRARGIPARVVGGYTLPFSEVPQHDWAEVWLTKHGWTAFDPFRAEWDGRAFERLENEYIWLSTVRNDAVLDGHHYYGYRFWGDPIRLTRTFRAIPRIAPVTPTAQP